MCEYVLRVYIPYYIGAFSGNEVMIGKVIKKTVAQNFISATVIRFLGSQIEGECQKILNPY